MNLYERVKQAVPLRDAAECYGLNVTRSQMICCPFHEERTPSFKLYEDHYYCFGCGASGDVINLTAQIFGITFHEAAHKLAADFGNDPNQPPPALAIQTPRVRNLSAFYRRILTDYASLLRTYRRDYAPTVPGESWDNHYVESCKNLPYVEHLIECIDDDPQRTMTVIEGSNLMHLMAQELDRIDKKRYAA